MKLNICPLTDLSIPLLDIYPREMETCPQKDFSKNVYSRFVHCFSQGSPETRNHSAVYMYSEREIFIYLKELAYVIVGTPI